MKFEPLENQPPVVEWLTADQVFIKQMYVQKAGSCVPQHSHVYDHTSMLARGAVRVWEDGKLIGNFHAPKPLLIKKGVKHTFMTLEDDTVIYCIHNGARPDVAAVLEEHQLVGEI